MERNLFSFCWSNIILLLLVLAGSGATFAQTLPNMPKRDTAANKTNDGHWKDDEAVVTYELLGSAKTYTPDTFLHGFHRRPFEQPWYRNLGNPGSPTYNMLFTPYNNVGPSLGYHIYDVYRFHLDSMQFYNTTRPYSVFVYQLGSKLEQVAGLLHTQNIKPNWNFMVNYRKVNAPGFYQVQRNNHDNFCLSTNYKSLSKRYTLYAGMVYNKEQHDENGGVVSDTLLTDPAYFDRRTVQVAYQNSSYSSTRSSVTNVLRDFGLLLQHSYTFGPVDTTYNADSTEYDIHLKPRFSITHKLELSTEKHTFKDLTPDSLRYLPLFNASFGSRDSVFSVQKWFWIDNRVMLNGFIGSDNNSLKFSAGIGNRFDEFITDPTPYYHLNRNRIGSNYLVGEIKKEALKPGEWEYGGKALLYMTGDYAGNFDLQAVIAKFFAKNGSFRAGFSQQLGSAPYAYTRYENRYTDTSSNFGKESVTSLYAMVENRKLRLSAGIRNYIISNYIYVDPRGANRQYTDVFNVPQLWVRHVLRVGRIYLDNEVVLQRAAMYTPVVVPPFMARHLLTYEHNGLFEHKLKVSTGIEVRETSNDGVPGYNALLNRFTSDSRAYYNFPEVAVMLNFALKHFRAFIMVDQVQQLVYRNPVLFTGNMPFYATTTVPSTPVYAAQNTTFRFGFNWVLIN